MLTREMGDHFPVTYGLGGGAAELSMPCEKSLHFLDESVGKHPFNPLFDAAVEFRTIPPQYEDATQIRRPPLVKMKLLMTDRLTGDPKYLESSNDAPLIAGMKFRGGERIDHGEPLMERLNAHLGDVLVYLAPKLPVSWRALVNASKQSL